MNEAILEQVKQKIEEVFPAVVAFRRDLHEHPELSGQEERTSRRIAEELEKLGVSYRVTPEKAVVGTVPGSGPAPSGKYRGLASGRISTRFPSRKKAASPGPARIPV